MSLCSSGCLSLPSTGCPGLSLHCPTATPHPSARFFSPNRSILVPTDFLIPRLPCKSSTDVDLSLHEHPFPLPKLHIIRYTRSAFIPTTSPHFFTTQPRAWCLSTMGIGINNPLPSSLSCKFIPFIVMTLSIIPCLHPHHRFPHLPGHLSQCTSSCQQNQVLNSKTNEVMD